MNRTLFFPLALAVTLVSLALSLAFGAVSFSPGEVMAAWHSARSPADFFETPAGGVLELRTLRLVSCVLVGSLLALTGSVLQRLLRNPLADPFVLGISSGGTVAVVAATVLGLPAASAFGVPLRSLYAFVGCFVALAILLAARSRLRRSQDMGLALLGLVLNAFFGAALMLFVAFASAQQLSEAQRWMLGSLQLVGARELCILALIALAPAISLLRARPSLDALLFGDDYAQTLGFRSANVRRRALLACAILVSLVVSIAGSVGFVGLIVPHLARLFTRRAPRAEFALSMGLGALLLIWSDALARTVAAPAELPVGVFTACLGAPVLAAVLLRRVTREEEAA